MTPQWNADIITPEEKGSGTQVIGDNQQVQTTLESGDNITIEDGKISATGDLENVQADWTQSDSADPSYIKHKPTLATVATSGDYSDLSNRPDLSVYATTSEVADKADKVSDAVSGNLAGLDSNGNLTDSGVAAANLVHDASYVHTDNNFSDSDVTKLSGIAAGAEVNVQANWSQTDNSADDFIKNKPDMSIYAQSANLATVATSGSYTDLVNKPTIPDAQVQSNWNETDTNSKAYIQNKPSIPAAQVQSDWDQTNSSAPDFIKNKPTIPAGVVVDQTYNASSTNAQAGVAVAEAIASVPAQVQADWNETNTSSKAYIQNKPTIPAAVTVDQTYNASSTNAQSGVAVASAISTKQDTIADLATIRSGAAAGATAVQPSSLATVATSGSYNDLSDKPSIPAAQVNSDWNSSSGVSQILNKPTLATVATTGDYDDLLNKPSIPAAQVQSDWSQSDSSAVDFIKNKPTIPAAVTVDQTYNASSSNPQSGTAVAEAVASISVDEVPAVTSSDNNKVLKATYSGGTGSYAWADDQGSTYTAGDGIAIDNDEISAKIGEGLDIGSSSSTASISGSFVQTPYTQVPAYNIYNLVEIAPMSSELIGAVDDSNGLSFVSSISFSATLSSQQDPETFDYLPKDTYLAVASLSYQEVYNPTIGTNNVVCSINGMVVFSDVTSLITVDSSRNKAYFDIGTQFTLSSSNINSTYSTIAWDTVKANPSQYSIVLVVNDGNDVFEVDYLTSRQSSAAITVGTYSGQSTVTVNGVINVSNPLPSVGSGDNGKVLKATYSGGSGSYDWESPPTEKNLVAGSNVSITSSGDNVTIAATDTTYTFSTGLTESSGTVTVTNPVPTPSSSDENKVLGVTDSSGTLGWVAGGSGSGNEVPSVTSNDDGKILKASYSGGTGSYSWQAEAKKPVVAGTGISITNNTNDVTIAATSPVPTVTSSDDGKVLKATYSGGTGSYAWGSDDNTTYTAGNMIAIDSNNSNAIGVSTTAGITDIQQVAALPANPVSTVLYLIPET